MGKSHSRSFNPMLIHYATFKGQGKWI